MMLQKPPSRETSKWLPSDMTSEFELENVRAHLTLYGSVTMVTWPYMVEFTRNCGITHHSACTWLRKIVRLKQKQAELLAVQAKNRAKRVQVKVKVTPPVDPAKLAEKEKDTSLRPRMNWNKVAMSIFS